MNDPSIHSRMRERLQLYLVMGSVNCQADPTVVLREAIRGGITMFQYREKGSGSLQAGAKLELGLRLRGLCRQYGIPFIVNDDVDLALQLDADGVHIGQEDERAGQVRDKLKGRIMGVSVHNRAEALAALADGADYLGIGPMYATATKLDTHAVVGPQLIRDLRAQGIDAPIVGIGGIKLGNADAVVAAGADGIAVVSAISGAALPEQAALQLRRIVLGNLA